MAKLFGPGMSLDASGTLAKVLTYSKWKGRNYLRKRVKPANPRSATQVSVRAMQRFLSLNYVNLSAASKALWLTAAKKTRITAANAFSSFNAKRWTQGNAPMRDANQAAGSAPVMGATTATAGKGQVVFSQAITTPNAIWGILICMSQTTGFTPGRANLRWAQFGTASPIAATVIRLAAGTWFYRIAGFNDGGTASAFIAEASVVVT